jgi:outer membrane protein
MKKSTFSLVLCTLAILTTLQAQTEKGSWLIGSTTQLTGGLSGVGIGFGTITQRSSFTNDEDKVNTFSFNINPVAGYFVAKDFAVGLSVNYGYGRSTFDQGADEKSIFSAFGVSPFARYYFSSGAKFRPFAALSGSFTRSNTTLTLGANDDSDRSYNIYGFDLGAGGAFFLSNKVSLDLFVNYGFRSGTSETSILGRNVSLKDTQSNLGIGVGFSIFL